MALRIRLTRVGSRHRPCFRLAVVDSRSRRDGRSTAVLGYYHPLDEPHTLKIQSETALEWLKKGAQPTDTARSLLKQAGVWQRFQLQKQGKSEEEVEAEVAKSLDRIKSKTNAELSKLNEKREAVRAAAAEARMAARAKRRAAAAPESSESGGAEEPAAETAPAE